MTPERWKKITEVYQSALEITENERDAYLARECGEDTTLRREVQSLLKADAGAGDFISGNVFEGAAEIIGGSKVSLGNGEKLGHYQVVSKIGMGGMGEVFLATDTKLNRPVAIKTLPLYFAANDDYLKRFRTEVTASASLNHPNIATIFSVEEIDGLPFFTMEYVDGMPLNKLVQNGPIEIELFLEIFIRVAEAFSHAHRKGVIHRDIKPGNILVQKDGTPKVLDFGLAHLDRDKHERSVTGSSITIPGQVLGTPAYMSPEQAEGKQVDVRSDIFSLGVVMYEAITGRRPFGGENYASIVSKLLRTDPVSVTDIKPSVPFLLSRLIHRCLEKTPRKRFQTMDEVRAILEEVKAAVDAGVSMDTSSADRLVTGRRKINKPAITVAGGFIFALLVILGYVFFFGGPGRAEDFRVENFTFSSLSQSNDVVYAGISPDGNSVAYNTIEPNGNRSMWIRLVDDRNALRLMESQTVHYWGGLTFSNDGSQIYFITAKQDAGFGTLYRISGLGGQARKLVDNVNDLGSMSPDGKHVLIVRYMDTMKLILADADDGSTEDVIMTGDANTIFRDPHYSADGTLIYLIKVSRINGDENWSLIEIPAEGGEERVIIPDRKERINEVVPLKDGSGLLVNAVDPVSNLAQLYFVSPADGEQTRITNDLNEYFGISVSDDGNRIVAAQRVDEKDIWIGKGKDFSTYRRVTSEATFHLVLEWAGNDELVYDAVGNNRPHIFKMKADGTGKEQLTPDGSTDESPVVTPDGSAIYFVSERTGELKIWRMNSDGTGPSVAVDRPGTMEKPVISRDGKTLYFDCSKGSEELLCRQVLATGAITARERYSDQNWALSPDGKFVAFRSYDSARKRFVVKIAAIDAGSEEVTFDISPINVFQWSQDGQGLIYRDLDSGERGQSTIWYQAISGGEPRPYIESENDLLYRLAISPDGTRNAVVTRRLLTDAVMLDRRAKN